MNKFDQKRWLKNRLERMARGQIDEKGWVKNKPMNKFDQKGWLKNKFD